VAFSDLDPLEAHMGTPVEEMTADQLVTYLKDYQLNLNGLDLKVAGPPEYKRMVWLQENYPQPAAGRIIKWTYWKYRGRWRNRHGDREVVFPRWFCERMRWWVDRMYSEMQQELIREENRRRSPAAVGMPTGDDL